MTDKSCDVCKDPAKTDTVEVRLVWSGTIVRVCGACGYKLMADGELGDEDEDGDYDEEADE